MKSPTNSRKHLALMSIAHQRGVNFVGLILWNEWNPTEAIGEQLMEHNKKEKKNSFENRQGEKCYHFFHGDGEDWRGIVVKLPYEDSFILEIAIQNRDGETCHLRSTDVFVLPRIAIALGHILAKEMDGPLADEIRAFANLLRGVLETVSPTISNSHNVIVDVHIREESRPKK